MAKNTQPVAKLDPTKRHTGGCHCGAVRFEVTVDATHGGRCNCSICTKVAQLGAMVKPAAFTLLSGKESTAEYAWGGKISTRHFCKVCGVHCFGSGHLAELGGDFVSINLNTLDDVDPSEVSVVNWDGRHDNWQAGPRSTPWPIVAPEPSETSAA
jgi:hypothetical protein